MGDEKAIAAADAKIIQTEIAKYKKVWRHVDYKFYSSEIIILDSVIEWAKKLPIYTILVVGCGEGYGIHQLLRAGFDAYGLDLVNVGRMTNVRERIRTGTAWNIQEHFKNRFDLIIAIDVMEHIPKEKIDATFESMRQICKFFYFAIACREDKLGKLIGDTLHLTVCKPQWWLSQIDTYLNVSGYEGGMSNLRIFGKTKLQDPNAKSNSNNSDTE